LFVAVLFPGLLCLAGLLVDGGARFRAAENVVACAQEAARAGAGMINRDTAYATGVFVVDQRQAIAAARASLSQNGCSGTVTAAGPHSIGVTATITQPTVILSLIGIASMTSTGQASANLVTGVTGPSGGLTGTAGGPAVGQGQEPAGVPVAGR
jgi:hypothetical protein